MLRMHVLNLFRVSLPQVYGPHRTMVRIAWKTTRVWESTAYLLQYHGVDTKKPSKTLGRALNYDVKTAPVLNILAINNIGIGRAVRRNPQLLSQSPNVLSARLASLQGLGIEIPRAINCQPTVLNYLSATIENKMLFLSSLGFDATALIHRRPAVLTNSDQAIRACIAFLHASGLDAMRLISEHPQILGSNIDRKLRPIIEFVTQEMGRSLEEINRCPRCLSASLQQRLKPRYQYVVLHGKHKDFRLSTFATQPDTSFSRIVSDKPLEHYRQWRTSKPP